MTRGIWICAAIAALSHAARADGDADALKKVVAAQAAAIGHMDPEAFAATIASDTFVMVPGGYAKTPDAAGQAMDRSWSNPEGSVSVKVGKVVVGHQDAVAWVAADLVFTEKVMDSPPVKLPYRFTELLTREGGAWKVRAMYASHPRKDQPSDWVDQTFDEHPPGNDADVAAPLRPWMGQPADLALHLRAGNDVVVYGSAANERGAGAAAGKLLGQWKKLSFVSAWYRAGGDGKTYAWIAARVMRSAKIKGGYAQEPYWVLVLGVKGARDWEVVGIHYAQDAPASEGGE